MLTRFELKINPLTVVLLIGFVVCLVIILKSCDQDLGSEIGRLKGEIEARDEQIKIKEQGLAEIKADRDRIEAEMNGAIDSANTVIANLEVEDHNKSETISRLEYEYKQLVDEGSQILNLKAQVEMWKDRFSLAQDKLSEKDVVIFSLQEKYEAELELRKAGQVVLEEYRMSLGVRDELISELTQKLRHTNRWRTLERLAFLAVGGLLLYGAAT